MSSPPGVLALIEAFVHYYYESVLLDPERLRMLMAPDCKYTFKAVQLRERRTTHNSRRGPESVIACMREQYAAVGTLDIIAWTPQTNREGVSLKVSCHWRDSAGALALQSEDTISLAGVDGDSSGTSRRHSFSISSVSSHIQYQ